MPTVRIPLVGVHNQRGINAQAALSENLDQRFVNVVFSVVTNPITGKSTVYVEKRPGWVTSSLVSAGNPSTGLLRTDSIGSVVSAFGDTNSTIYDGTVSVGVITGRALHFSEAIISDIGYILIRSSDGTGWYYTEDAKDVTAYTADGNNSTTITDLKVAGSPSTAGLYVGQVFAAASNIVAGSRIVSINTGAFSLVLDTATTGGAFSDLAITKTAIAKITDPDYLTTGTQISAFVEMDGYEFYANEDGYIRHSDLNSATAWTATNRLAANASPDSLIAIARQLNVILGFGSGSIQGFHNAGNASGSVLSRVPQLTKSVGIQDQRSLAKLKDDIYFATSSRYGDTQIMRMRGFEIQPVSPSTIDNIIGTLTATGSDIYLCGFQLGGCDYLSVFVSMASETESASLLLLESSEEILLETGDSIIIGATSSVESSFGRHLIYNATSNIWAEWDCNLCTFISGLGQSSTNQIIATSRVNTSGKIYVINASQDQVYTDDGSAFTMSIRTSRINHGTNKRKFDREIRLIGDIQEAGTATLSVCDDDSGTYTTLGTFDLTKPNPKITRCGSYEGGRSYLIEHSYNGPFRAEAIEIDHEVAQ